MLEQGHLDLQGDPEWMAALANENVEVGQLNEMMDAFGNAVKIKQMDTKKPSRTCKETKQKARAKKLRIKHGEKVTDSDSDGDW